MKNRAAAIVICKIIPKNFISRFVGFAAGLNLPRFLMGIFIRRYSAHYGIKAEYIIPAGGFKSFDEFFTRKLAPGVRSVNRSKRVAVSPVDGRIDQYGDIRESTLIQAKGIAYSLFDLIPSGTAKKFINGKFMTLYLSPADYHRIHSPVSGMITGYFNIPGKLFTVQDCMVQGLPGLFVNNERIVTYIQCAAGAVAVCKIGALNVGKISLSYRDVRTNKLFRRRREFLFDEQERVPVTAGGEIGVFHLGSTIILLFQKGSIAFNNFQLGDKIRMGDDIGSLKF
ncbi:MAG: phosphatidylserine decarboxylase [Spirochaetes bacterium RBG_16_49_21]|nr:MAG: phosphatidylserine decarboxylase [Spirochaetes bacterium RBG_16_49_21]